MGFAKIDIIGNLGRDPEMRYTPAGKAVTEFSVAVNQSKRDQQTGEWSDETDWYRVTVWGERAERIAELVHKGSKVFVSGRFRARPFEDKQGVQRTSLDISADDVVSLDPKQAAAESDEGGTVAAPVDYRGPGDKSWGKAPKREMPDDLDDLPF